MKALPIVLLAVVLCAIEVIAVRATTEAEPTPPPATTFQLQRSVMLSAGRYVKILEGLEAGSTEETKDSIDWWIDLSIMELASIEEHFPKHNWGDVSLNEDSVLKMRAAYRQIAQFRRDHPRRHRIPLEPAQLQVIQSFVEKYQSAESE